MANYLFLDMLRSRLSQSHFWQFFFFTFFLRRAESHSAGLKVVRCYSLLYTSPFWFPKALPTCAMRGRWFFLLFLLGHLVLVASPLFLVFLFCLFLLNCLNLSLIVFIRLGGSKPFGGRWGSRLSFLLQSPDMGFFSFSHKLLGLPFFLLYVSSLLGLPFLLFRGPLALISLGLAYFFGLGYYDLFRPQQRVKNFLDFTGKQTSKNEFYMIFNYATKYCKMKKFY